MASSDRVRLVVLFGGRSAEHDVSCTTAAHVLAATDPERYDVVPVGITREGAWVRADEARAALARGVAALPDRLDATGTALEPLPTVTPAADGQPVVVLPLLHGPFGEDGTVQGMLECLDLPYVGPGVLAAAVAIDKLTFKRVLAFHGIPQVEFCEAGEDGWRDRTAAMGLPLWVKPARLGSSVGISKVASVEGELDEAIQLARRHDPRVIVEAHGDGKEVECSVLGNEAPRTSPPARSSPTPTGTTTRPSTRTAGWT